MAQGVQLNLYPGEELPEEAWSKDEVSDRFLYIEEEEGKNLRSTRKGRWMSISRIRPAW